MEEAQADTSSIRAFIALLQEAKSVDAALEQVAVPTFVAQFVQFTFQTIATQEPARIAAAFTFGREDVIPDMFLAIIDQEEAHREAPAYAKLRYYLQRHIELDGDEHGPLSLQMMEALCGTDAQKWQAATETAVEALQQRVLLWDGIERALNHPLPNK
jgi:hypothetical protein